MAAARAEAVQLLFAEIYKAEPAITSADELLEFARRHNQGKHFRPKRQEAVDYLRQTGRYQVYKSVNVEWEGRISKHPQTDTRFDLDLWDGRASAPDDPEQEGVKYVMLLQDRFSRLLAGAPLQGRTPGELLAAFNALLAHQRADARHAPGVGI